MTAQFYGGGGGAAYIYGGGGAGGSYSIQVPGPATGRHVFGRAVRDAEMPARVDVFTGDGTYSRPRWAEAVVIYTGTGARPATVVLTYGRGKS